VSEDRGRVRDLVAADLAEVVRIDAGHMGRSAAVYWADLLPRFTGSGRAPDRVALACDGPDRLAGYLLGEVRAFEFGSEPCGWIFAVGIDPRDARLGVGTRLLDAGCRRFADAGVARVRTMVERTNVPVLAFFRANGFVGGSFVQLELDLSGEPRGSGGSCI